MQETIKANEALRGENQALNAQMQALRSKAQCDEDRHYSSEQKVAELTKRNLLIDTEN